MLINSDARPSYDRVAPEFEYHRRLPDSVPCAVRHTVIRAVQTNRPRILDLGAGTGRIGLTFVAAGDDYVGVDLSLGMLRQFARQADLVGRRPQLVHANGLQLPFRNTTFDAVLLIQVMGAARDWRGLITEAQRVLRRGGRVIIGHTVAPIAGVDEQMKQHLASLVADFGITSYHVETRGVAQPWLEACARTNRRIIAAQWSAERWPAQFLTRQPSGARFAGLPKVIQVQVLDKLAAWAKERFGSLDTRFSEQYKFELQIFEF